MSVKDIWGLTPPAPGDGSSNPIQTVWGDRSTLSEGVLFFVETRGGLLLGFDRKATIVVAQPAFDFIKFTSWYKTEVLSRGKHLKPRVFVGEVFDINPEKDVLTLARVNELIKGKVLPDVRIEDRNELPRLPLKEKELWAFLVVKDRDLNVDRIEAAMQITR